MALADAVLYVKNIPAGSYNCSAWENACTLQDALGIAANGDAIWVAGGTYTPHASDRTFSFVLQNGVKVYGGFAGTENDLDQRDIAANPTILSGDLARDDHTGGSNAENAYHVVVGDGTDGTAVLDGFTIPANANAAYPDNTGGGMRNLTGSPTLTNVTFNGDSANAGSGMHNFASSSPTLENVTFSGNSAGGGGGMSNVGSSPTLANVTFSDNSTSGSGGGMYNYFSDLTLTNVTFSGNSANFGGGMVNQSSSRPTLVNVIIADSTGGDCVNSSTTLNTSSTHNLIKDSANACGLTSNFNIIGEDPKLGPLAYYGSVTLTHALLPGSPAIDAGDNTACPATDQRGVARPQGGACDIGAFEVPYLFLPLILR